MKTTRIRRGYAKPLNMRTCLYLSGADRALIADAQAAYTAELGVQPSQSLVIALGLQALHSEIASGRLRFSPELTPELAAARLQADANANARHHERQPGA